MRRISTLFIFTIILIFSCKKDQDMTLEKGDIYAIVKYNDGSPAANALVYTNPETGQDSTDEFGSVLIKNIKADYYELFAKVDNVGSGKTLINVISNKLTEAEIIIEYGVFYPDTIYFELYQPVKENENVKLIWSKYSGEDFFKYEVYRSVDGCHEEYLQYIGEIGNINDTVFFDETPPIEYQACYAIKVVNNNNESFLSNFYAIDYPSGMIFNFVPDDMFKHPTEAVVYLIDNEVLKLVKYNYENDSILKEVNLYGDIGFCDIGDNGFGLEIYVPSDNGNVYVYNGDDLSLATTISTELAATCVVTDGLGHLIVSVVPSPWWEEPIRTYSRSNGMNIDGGGERDYERLRKIPGRNEYISISQGVSPTDMNHYLFDESGYFLEENDDTYHGTYPLNARIFKISENGEYAITSYNGSVYVANSNMPYLGNLQNGNLHFSDFAFSSDGATIYAATSDRKSIQIGHYPSLIRDNEILLSGYPNIIQRNDNMLIISVMPKEENSLKSSIELVDIP